MGSTQSCEEMSLARNSKYAGSSCVGVGLDILGQGTGSCRKSVPRVCGMRGSGLEP